MAEKQITTNQLAQMIKKGFDGVDKRFEEVVTKKQFDDLDKRLVGVEKDVKYIKDNLEDARKLEQRVGYIENAMSIQPIKN